MTRLQKRNAMLEEKITKANQVIDSQGKVYALLRVCWRECGSVGLAAVEQAVTDISVAIGERDACKLLGLHRGSVQRRRAAHAVMAVVESLDASASNDVATNLSQRITRQVRRYLERQAAKVLLISSRALSPRQNQELLDAVHQERFIDRSVPYIYATLLDENRYYGSISTTYRVLHRAGEVGERRDQATRPAHVKPELCAMAPNRVYAWDITKLHGPQKWTYYYLYIVIDIYSRYVVGWMVADRESSELAKLLLETTIKQQGANLETAAWSPH